jgi:hypothetical protein
MRLRKLLTNSFLVILYISPQKRVYGEVVYMWRKNELGYTRIAMYGGTLIICAAISMLIESISKGIMYKIPNLLS